MEIRPHALPQTSTRHKRRHKHRKRPTWRRWFLRLMVIAVIALAAMLGYWIAEHLNQRPPADYGAVLRMTKFFG